MNAESTSPRYRITSIRPQVGEAVSVQAAGVTCVVGANNAGKSQLLKDLVAFAKHGKTAQMVVLSEASHAIAKLTHEQASNWLERHAVQMSPQPFVGGYTLLPSQNGIDLDGFVSQLRRAALGHDGLDHIDEAFIRRISAGSLSSYVSGELRTEWTPDQHLNWLLHRIHRDGDLEREVGALVNELFAVNVFMDRYNFPPRLRAGQPSVPSPLADQATKEYAQALDAVPALDEQGDGMRSFAGLALVVLALSPEVLLLDEPESFLHPGQARAVGRWLATTAKARNMQVIVATHDRDFLVGMLSAGGASNVEVVRIERGTAGSRLHTIDAQQLDSYWEDPVLRYSNALQGLFHERVVVCEGDVDCRFYSAGVEEMAADRGMRHISDDTLFVSGSGKNGLSKMVGVLAELGVRAAAIGDFDLLDTKGRVVTLVRSLGHEWSTELDAAYLAMTKHVGPNPDSFWKSAKKGGMATIPRGSATRAFQELIALLRAVQLHIVPCGELEDFYPEVGKGTEWIASALAAQAHKSQGVRDLLAAAIPELALNEPPT